MKIKKILNILTITPIVSVCCLTNLSSCFEKEPEEDDKVNISVVSDDKNLITLSNLEAHLNTEYETDITLDSTTKTINTVNVKVKNNYLLYNKQFTFVDNKLKVNQEVMTEKEITIYITTRIVNPFTGQDPEEFISDRTFSIMGINTSTYECVLGTGWILDDATPNTYTDYSYYIATNWHVTHGFDQFIEAGHQVVYCYADKSLGTSGSISINDYKSFPNDGFKELDKAKTSYSSNDQEKDTNYFKKAIDMFFCKVNFGDPKGAIKTKLDKLNTLRKQKGYINVFANMYDPQIQAKEKAIGGYPGWQTLDDAGSKWEFHKDLNDSHFDIVDRNETTFQYTETGPTQIGHGISDPDKDQQGNLVDPDGENFYYYDISPQYQANQSFDVDWMDAGSSGSMLITEDCEICGIYWGGWGDDFNFYPAFSLFNTHDKNFLTNL